jgi:transcription-repair coupling factor (superfamily II helicase)
VPPPVERLFEYARLRRVAEEVGVASIDKTQDGLAIKLNEKARVAPEKLMALVGTRAGTTFTPSGVLRLELSEEESEFVLETARGVLLEIQLTD